MSVADPPRVVGPVARRDTNWPQLAWWQGAAATATEALLTDRDGPYRRWSDPPVRARGSGDGAVRPAGDVLLLTPAPPRDRASRRRQERLLREVWCQGGLPCLLGAPARGASLTVIESPGANEHFVDLVAAVGHEWELTMTVVGTVALSDRRRPPPDTDAATGAICLARSIGERLGDRPDWEVQYGKTHASAAASYIRQHRSSAVAIAHTSHRPRAHCPALDLALQAAIPALLA